MPAVTGNTSWFRDEFGADEILGHFKETQQLFSCVQLPPPVAAAGAAATPAPVQLVAPNKRTFHVGSFETPSVAELRAAAAAAAAAAAQGATGGVSPGTGLQSPRDVLGGLRYRNLSGDARSLHMDPSNAGAVFMVASQFNCLEMVGPGERPEDGVTVYAKDHTQGPACALACPAATVFRNYFVRRHGDSGVSIGQAGGSAKQVDNTMDVAALLNNRKHKYWKMSNGYLLPTEPGRMQKLAARLCADPTLCAEAVSRVRVGVHWDTQTATPNRSKQRALVPHRVCQVFASAVPVAYAKATSSKDWQPLAKVFLDGAFEATLAAAAVLAWQRGQRVKVYLTSIGGGAFGNRSIWILAALERALELFREAPLDVWLVAFRKKPSGHFDRLEARFQ